jgi:hypothetical protein
LKQLENVRKKYSKDFNGIKVFLEFECWLTGNDKHSEIIIVLMKQDERAKMSDEEKNEAARKALGEPVAKELSDSVLRITRNLLAISIISITIISWNLDVDTSTLLGFKFTGLTKNNLNYGLLIINAYLFLHYLWCCFDNFAAWKIRITGTRVLFKDPFWQGNIIDSPIDPRQSTLYNWFQLCRRTQDLRWLIIDVMVPLFVGGFSFVLLFSNL